MSKKYYHYFLLLLLVVGTTVVSSCKGDDDTDDLTSTKYGSVSENDGTFILGTWEGYVTVNGDRYNVVMDFKNGRLTMTQYIDGKAYIDAASYTLNTKQHTITIKPDNPDEGLENLVYTYEYEVDGDEEELEFTGNGQKWKFKRAAKNPESVSLTGTWRHVFSTGYVDITFYSNGSGRIIEYDHGKLEYSEYFTYTYMNGYINIKEDRESYRMKVLSLTASKLVVIDPDGYQEEYSKIS